MSGFINGNRGSGYFPTFDWFDSGKFRWILGEIDERSEFIRKLCEERLKPKKDNFEGSSPNCIDKENVEEWKVPKLINSVINLNNEAKNMIIIAENMMSASAPDEHKMSNLNESLEKLNSYMVQIPPKLDILKVTLTSLQAEVFEKPDIVEELCKQIKNLEVYHRTLVTKIKNLEVHYKTLDIKMKIISLKNSLKNEAEKIKSASYISPKQFKSYVDQVSFKLDTLNAASLSLQVEGFEKPDIVEELCKQIKNLEVYHRTLVTKMEIISLNNEAEKMKSASYISSEQLKSYVDKTNEILKLMMRVSCFINKGDLFEGSDMQNELLNQIKQLPSLYKCFNNKIKEINETSQVTEMSKLMNLNGSEWEKRDTKILIEKMEQYCTYYVPPGEEEASVGFFEKYNLEPGTDIAVIGDIHGNDLRLELTLKALQKQGFLDEQFRCLPGKKIVFLGDYGDRGRNSVKVLELLFTLKLENKDQVCLLRGNHEDLSVTKSSSHTNDEKYGNFLKDPENTSVLKNTYKRLPLCAYFGVKNKEGKKMQCMQFCHGAFDIYTDPGPLLDENNKPYDYMWIISKLKFSKRIKKLIKSSKNGIPAKELVKIEEILNKKGTRLGYKEILWGDFNRGEFCSESKTGRTEYIAEMAETYIKAIGTKYTDVKEIIRAHQGGIWSMSGKEKKTVVTTLDPSRYRNYQFFLTLNTDPKVRNWKKQFHNMPLLDNDNKELDHKIALGKMDNFSTRKLLDSANAVPKTVEKKASDKHELRGLSRSKTLQNIVIDPKTTDNE